MSLPPGNRLGPYEIVGAIGAGGMGEVYRATDTKLKRDVDAARNGKRFLIAEDPNPGAQPRLDVVVHWSAEVQRKVAEARTP